MGVRICLVTNSLLLSTWMITRLSPFKLWILSFTSLLTSIKLVMFAIKVDMNSGLFATYLKIWMSWWKICVLVTIQYSSEAIILTPSDPKTKRDKVVWEEIIWLKFFNVHDQGSICRSANTRDVKALLNNWHKFQTIIDQHTNIVPVDYSAVKGIVDILAIHLLDSS